MNAATLPISRLIHVDVNLAPAGAEMQNISTMLILGSTPGVIDVVERYRVYNSSTEVLGDFDGTTPEYLASVVWFEQAPKPAQLLIGRWAKTATAARLIGSTLPVSGQTMAQWQAITTGAFFINVNGIPIAVNGLNFTTATNLNGVASSIQTALSAQSGGCTVVWNSAYGRFEVTSGTTGATSTLSLLKSPTAVGNYLFTNQPAANDFITLNGTAVTFVAGTPIGNQVQIGANIAATLTNLLTMLQASTDVQLVKFLYSVVGTTLYTLAAAPGVGGNSLTIAKSGANITVSGATLAGGNGTDISALLGATSAFSGAYVASGVAPETALAAAALFDNNYGQTWYGLSMLGITDDDCITVASFIESTLTKHVYGVTVQDTGSISSVSTSDLGYRLKQMNLKRTVWQYSTQNAYAAVSLLGRILTTDYTGNNTTITLMYKQEPGIVPESINTSQITALEAKNGNVFVAYNNDTAIIEKGVMANGDFVDIILGTDWLALAIQNDIFNAQYTSSTKIPQTDPGNHSITTVIQNRCSSAVDNGLLAPGVWTAQGFGALNTGDYMPSGFYIYAPPIGTQNPTDRAARKSVLFQIAVKLAGALHEINVLINVNR